MIAQVPSRNGEERKLWSLQLHTKKEADYEPVLHFETMLPLFLMPILSTEKDRENTAATGSDSVEHKHVMGACSMETECSGV